MTCRKPRPSGACTGLIHARAVAFVPLFITLSLLLALVSCNPSADSDEQNQLHAQGNVDLNKPVPPEPDEGPGLFSSPNPSAEELWTSRCGLCHEKELGLDKYKGDEWYPIIGRMMNKKGSFINAEIARKIYVYLYEKTTGEKPPNIEEFENVPVSSAGGSDSI